MKVDASGKVTTEILNTLFYERPEHEILENGQKGRLIGGTDTIVLYGGFEIGKTVDILIALRMIAQYQTPTNNIRKIKVGVVRESNDAFVEHFASKIEMFDPRMQRKTDVGGFMIYDAKQRAKCKWRFRSSFPDGNGGFQEDGTITEIELHAFSVDSEPDIQKWRGAEMTVMIFNEGNNQSEYCYDMLSPRNDRFPFDGADYPFVIMDLNPRLTTDWDFKRFIKKKPKGTKVIQYPSPLLWVPDIKGEKTYLGQRGTFIENPEFVSHRKDGYAKWHSMTDGSDQTITNNVLGQYFKGSSGTAVHNSFSADRHIKQIEQPRLEDIIVIGVDPGYANGFVTGYFIEQEVKPNILGINTTDDLMSAMTDKKYKKVFRVMDSYFGDGGFHLTWHQIIMPLLNKPDYVDHLQHGRILFIADPRTIKKRSLTDGTMSIDVIEDAGFEVTVPTDERGRVIDDIGLRINTIDRHLKADRLIVDPRNEALITSFVTGYVSKNGGSEPDKKKSGGYAEVMDALQYVLLFEELGGNIHDHIRPLSFSRATKSSIHNLLYS